MFMFWGKRTSYTKRLLKAQVRGEHETECEAQEKNNLHLHTIVGNRNSPESSSSSSSRSNYNYNYNYKKEEKQYSNNGCCSYAASVLINGNNSSSSNPAAQEVNNKSTNDIINNRTARCKEFLKTLKENQLEMLLAAVESYGANLGPCVMVKRRRRGSDADADADADAGAYADVYTDLDPNTDLHQTSQPFFHSSPDPCRVRDYEDDGDKGIRDVADGGTESFTMTTTTSNNTSTNKQIQDRNSPNYSPNRSQHHHHHHHHHHQNHQHHYNNHNRVQRQQRQFNNVNVNQNEDSNLTVNNHAGAADDKLLFLKERQRDYEENILLGERIATTTTTSSSGSTRRSRNSGNSNIELPVDPHLLCCQIWRWPDLTNSSELKRLPVCHSAKDPVDICCNPYHWSRLCKPESPPPPYCLIADRLRPEDRAPSEGRGGDGPIAGRYRNTNSPPLPGSLTTNGEDLSGQREWCTLAYWELGGRVGRLYPVEPSTVNVFDSLLDGDGLCLATLAENHPTSPAIQRTRSKIGLGLMLSQESDGVWAYNRSENPIFVNSPTLDDPESRTLLVYRVPPGFCLNIFDRVQKLQSSSYNIRKIFKEDVECENNGFCCGADYCDNYCCSTCTIASHPHPHSSPRSPPSSPTATPLPSSTTALSGNFPSGPVDVNSVRISFAKGWGPKYSRQEVTSCPCWLEVLLAPCR